MLLFAAANWTGISTLWLDNTNLTGTIPVQWASMAQSLTQFSVENTLLSVRRIIVTFIPSLSCATERACDVS